MAVRTWAPQGQTPLLQVPLTRDHLAAISGITPDGRLFLHADPEAGLSLRRRRALPAGTAAQDPRQAAGHLGWRADPSRPARQGQPVKDFLRRGAAKRLHLEQLPGYAPELNPDEGIWNYLKRVELANLCCPDLPALAVALRRAKERLRHKRTIIQACIRQAGYPV